VEFNVANESAPREHLEPEETLGRFLKRERDLRGVSLREIAETTKINVRVLEALEADDYDSLPPRAFIIGFLRAYAQCLKIDPQDVIALYHRVVSEVTEVPVEPEPEEDLEDDHVLKRIVLLVVVGLFAASLFYVVFLRDWSPKAPKTKGTTSASGGTRSRSVEPGLQPAPAVVIARKAARPDSRYIERPLVLEVAAMEEAWLRVERDDGQISAMLLHQGERRQWQARERFVLTIGNVAGTRLFLDGRPVDLPSSRSNTLHNFVLYRRRASVALP
jgi:transcriptional regulator with XRE-family HTH domain